MRSEDSVIFHYLISCILSFLIIALRWIFPFQQQILTLEITHLHNKYRIIFTYRKWGDNLCAAYSINDILLLIQAFFSVRHAENNGNYSPFWIVFPSYGKFFEKNKLSCSLTWWKDLCSQKSSVTALMLVLGELQTLSRNYFWGWWAQQPNNPIMFACLSQSTRTDY